MDHTAVLMLAAAVSLDSAAAGAALGSSGIRLPKSSAMVISLAGAIFLLLPALFGDIISDIIPARICGIVSRALMFAMGGAALLEYFRELRGKSPDESDADKNRDRTLSAGEAAVLAAGLSADSAVTGISAGLSGTDAVSAAVMFFAALVTGYAAVTAGWHLGKKTLSGRIRTGWLSGLFLMILAFLI